MPIPLASICTCALLTQTSRWTFFFRLGVENPNSSTFESKKLFFFVSIFENEFNWKTCSWQFKGLETFWSF